MSGLKKLLDRIEFLEFSGMADSGLLYAKEEAISILKDEQSLIKEEAVYCTIWEEVTQVLKAHNIYIDKEGLVYDICQITKRRLSTIQEQIHELKK